MVGGPRLRRKAVPGEKLHYTQRLEEDGILYRVTRATSWGIAELLLEEGWSVLQQGEWLPKGQAVLPHQGGQRVPKRGIAKRPATEAAMDTHRHLVKKTATTASMPNLVAKIISLRKDRRSFKAARADIERLGLKACLSHGVPGLEMVESVSRDRKYFEVRFTAKGREHMCQNRMQVRCTEQDCVPGVLGCIAAHWHAMKTSLLPSHGTCPYTMILEDDAKLTMPNPSAHVIFTELCVPPLLSQAVDVLWLGGFAKPGFAAEGGEVLHKITTKGKTLAIIRTSEVWCGHAYVMRRAIMHHCFEFLQKGFASDNAISKAAKSNLIRGGQGVDEA